MGEVELESALACVLVVAPFPQRGLEAASRRPSLLVRVANWDLVSIPREGPNSRTAQANLAEG
jgi:hypothetical protein